MRASILILGPLLTRFGEVKISLPGGCAIGTRPIDIHLEGLKKLGANFVVENGYVIGRVKEKLIGNHISLPFPSVGATENILMASTIAKGKTIIENAAMEPEITDLASCLNKMGAKINIEKNRVIKIEGVKKLTKANHKIMSDRIVAGTFIIAAVMLNKNFEVKEIESSHLDALSSSLKEMGAKLKIKKNSIQIMPSKNLNGVKIQTAPYPGFPTDLQAQIMALMSLAKGNSQIKENIFENRFMHVPELNRLGADIKVKKDIAYISGERNLKGAQVMASDLRASVSLVLAALCAEGKSVINRVYHLDRGYEKIENTLGKLGPSIKRKKY
jgi:UDP-N-acetylglucosamine 1-carboxyvinyltransferase